MHLIDINLVIIPTSRQRREGKDTKSLEGLKKSILNSGLIHAPILTDNGTLVSGERRLLAVKELYEDGLTIRHDGEEVPSGHLPFTRLLAANEVQLLEVEYDENFWRLNLTWQEQNQAYVRIHDLKVALNPAHTAKETAAVILELKNQPVTPEAVNSEAVKLSIARTVAANLDHPAVAAAPNINKAYKALLDDSQRKLERDLIRLNPSVSPHTLLLGDFRTQAATLPPTSFDAIITDPPYGINAHTAGTSALGHQYDDTPTNAISFYQSILQLGFNLLKPMGTILMFCDIEHFITIRTIAEQQAFSTFRTPLVWHKGSEGHAPWGREGPKRCYETLLFAVKGQRSLVLPFGPDVVSVPRLVADPNRVHAAEKPVELLRFLVSRACRAGDRVLDPCCGSGAIFTAAHGLGIHVTGVELNEEYHTLAASRLARLASGEEPAPTAVGGHPEDLTDIMQRITEANNASEHQ